MPSSLSKNGGLTFFVTHMKIVSFSCAFRACFLLSKIKKFTRTRTRDLHKNSHVSYPIGQGVFEY